MPAATVIQSAAPDPRPQTNGPDAIPRVLWPIPTRRCRSRPPVWMALCRASPRTAGCRCSVYAAGFDRSSQRPRVGLLLAGVGLNSALSEQAIRTLPGGVTLAVSPYASDPAHLLTEARMAEHEYLISIPMEPESFPLNDPGKHALTTSNTPEDNANSLSGRCRGSSAMSARPARWD